jgi:hypothetical protein
MIGTLRDNGLQRMLDNSYIMYCTCTRCLKVMQRMYPRHGDLTSKPEGRYSRLALGRAFKITGKKPARVAMQCIGFNQSSAAEP